MLKSRCVLAALCAVICALTVPLTARAAPAMWRVRDADSEIFLFGTMHVLQPGLKWRTKLYDQTYARAGVVWFETDVAAPQAELSGLMAKYGVDSARPLSDKLSRSGLDSLLPLLDRRQETIERLDHLRPWAAAMALSVAPMVQRGGSVSSGADAVITRVAHAQAKPVRTFESLEDQMRMFSQMPESVEVQYLEDVIREQAHPSRDGVVLESAWMGGKVDRLAPLLVEPMRRDRPQLYDVLLKRRNLAWAATLTQEMRGRGVELVNVGALHLVGPDGLPALLAAQGFEVTRVQ
jgi:uncharacterized protein